MLVGEQREEDRQIKSDEVERLKIAASIMKRESLFIQKM